MVGHMIRDGRSHNKGHSIPQQGMVTSCQNYKNFPIDKQKNVAIMIIRKVKESQSQKQI